MAKVRKRREHNIEVDLVTLHELAAYYAVSERTIHRWIEQEIIPRGKRITPRCTRYSLKATAAAIEENVN